MRHFDLPPLENKIVYSYVGNGAPVLIRKALGPDYSDDEVQSALLYFLAYYREHMLDYTVLYPGVRDVLDRLLGAGITMAVLTNKPVRFSQAIIDGLGFGRAFPACLRWQQLRPEKAAPDGNRDADGPSAARLERKPSWWVTARSTSKLPATRK